MLRSCESQDLLNKCLCWFSGPPAASRHNPHACPCLLPRTGLRHHDDPRAAGRAQLAPTSCSFCTYSESFYWGQSLCKTVIRKKCSSHAQTVQCFPPKLINKNTARAFHYTSFSCWKLLLFSHRRLEQLYPTQDNYISLAQAVGWLIVRNITCQW